MENTSCILSIEDLPNEIIVMIFQNLNLDTIEICSNISIRWYYICIHFFYRSHLKSIAKFDEESRQNLIEEGWNNDCYDYEFIVDLYKRFKSYRARIIITTGVPHYLGKKTEIIDLSNPKIKCDYLADVPQRSGSVGGLIDGKPLICGGYLSGHPMADSFSVNETKFERKSYLTQQRAFAASVLLNSKTLWVVGGRDRDHRDRDLCTSEFVYQNQKPIPGPELPFKISSHGMIQYSKNAVIIIGGRQNFGIGGTVSRRTWIMDPTNEFELKSGN